MPDLIDLAVRGVGLAVLKAVTLGRYRSSGTSAVVVEGAVGLAAIAGVLWAVYAWLD